MRFFSEKPYTLDIIVRRVTLILLLIATFYFIKAISNALIPFVIALIFAYILNPIVTFLEQKIKFLSRTSASIICVITVLTSLFAIFWILIPYIANEIGNTASILKLHVERNSTFIPQEITDKIFDYLNQFEYKKMIQSENISLFFENVLPKIISLFSNTVSLILGVLSLVGVILYLFLILIYFDDISNGWYHLIPIQYQEIGRGILKDLNRNMNKYFRAQFIISMIVGVLFALGFAIIGLPLSIVLGITIGFLNLVPYLQMIAIPPVLLLVYVQSVTQNTSFGINFGKVFLVFILVQGFQDFFLVPKIMGKSTGLNPVVILLALSIWGSLLGVLGMLIALPMTTIMFSYYNRYFLSDDGYFKKQ